MSLHTIVGTWEEIERRKAELIGRQLRVTVLPDKPEIRKQEAQPADVAPAKKLRGRGMLKGLFRSEDYFREKREDTAREDRDLE